MPPLGFWPLLPFAFIVYKMIFPWQQRKIAWNIAFKVVCSPFFKVTFVMNFVGDVFTSLVKPIVDLTYSVCFFATGDFLQHLGEPGTRKGFGQIYGSSTGHLLFYLSVYLVLPHSITLHAVVPVIILGPYWFRFMQCIRRYFDTGKLPESSQCIQICTGNDGNNIFGFQPGVEGAQNGHGMASLSGSVDNGICREHIVHIFLGHLHGLVSWE